MCYTYLIINTVTGMFYYGARYSKDASCSDLWESYFTSSKTVKRDIKLYGKDAFYFEIRKQFDSVEDCLKWEHRVLRRLDAKNRVDCYNLTNGGAVYNSSKRMLLDNPMKNLDIVKKVAESKKKLHSSGMHKSTRMSENGCKKTSERLKLNNPMKNRDAVEKMVKSKLKNGTSSKGTRWMANPITKARKRIPLDQTDNFTQEGWIFLSNKKEIPEACQ